MTDWDTIDWETLERLRAQFLDGSAGRGDYWGGDADLDAYDRTFAQRIAWKLEHVLAELAGRGWSPPPGEVLDFGCGSGVAGRTFAAAFPAEVRGLAFHDRAARARAFAAGRARERFPDLPVRDLPDLADAAPATLLVSHVLTELAGRQREELLALADRAAAVVWVEPGTFDAGRALEAVRQRLRGRFHVVGPCTHGDACPLAAPGNERHWCHHFADPPADVYADGGWVRFGRQMGIDLRSLPLSWLALDRRPPAPLPADAVRILGRPRVHKGDALAFACGREGAREVRVLKRTCPSTFRELKKGTFATLQRWRCEDGDLLGE